MTGRGHPPLVEKVQVVNFRALREFKVDKLRPLTVLVGPNGSGKSTFFDVFAFLSDCFTDGVRRACDSRGGLRAIRSRGSAGPVTIELSYREARDGRLLTYRLEIDEQKSRPYIARETLRWTTAPAQGRPRNIIDFRRGQGRIWNETTGESSEQTLTDETVLAVDAVGQFRDHPRVTALRQFISGWHLSYLSVEDERRVVPAGPQERLSRTGENLSNVLQYLHEQHAERLEQITASLRDAIPTIDRIDYVLSADGRLVLQVKDRPFDEPVLARYASDGTLKFLAYLVLLNDPDPSPFIGVEEPENFLYPSLLPGLADMCRAAAGRSQILVTTHSYEFVNACRPEEVIALYRGADGYTSVVRPHESPLVQSMMRQGAELGALWSERYFENLPVPHASSASEED